MNQIPIRIAPPIKVECYSLFGSRLPLRTNNDLIPITSLLLTQSLFFYFFLTISILIALTSSTGLSGPFPEI